MKKKIIFSIYMVALLIFSIGVNSETIDLTPQLNEIESDPENIDFEIEEDIIETINADSVSYKGVEVEAYLTQNESYKKEDFDWQINRNKKTFSVKLKEDKTLKEFHYKTNKLTTEPICVKDNNYHTTCSYETLNFDTFLAKNQIDKQTITTIYKEDACLDEPFDEVCEVDYYLISFEGEITDTDPVFEMQFDSSTVGSFNQTEA